MESLYFIFSALLLFGITVPYTEARAIFEPIGNFFDSVPHDSVPAKVINTFLSPFRGSGEDEGPEIHHKKRHHEDSQAWWDHTSSKPIIANIFNDQPPVSGEVKPHGSSERMDVSGQVNKIKKHREQNNDDTDIDDIPTPSPGTPGSNSVEVMSEDTTPDGKKILRAITKRKFYFQARVVRPVGRHKNVNETVYYIDF